MWHVKYEFGDDQHTFDEEYVSGFVGKGRKYHAVNEYHHTLCGIEFRNYQYSDVGFSHEHRPIDCKNCLARLNNARNSPLTKNWVEDGRPLQTEQEPQ